MKTFEEAFEKTQKLTTHDLNEWKMEAFNEDWVDLITNMAQAMMGDIGRSTTQKDTIVACCATLQAIFVAGMLTGIEMEKD